MESTGVYWRPVFNVLEESCEQVMVVNAHHIRAVPGRKSDIKDAQWIAELLQHGLLGPSFIPPRPQRELRERTRGRKQLVGERSRVVNRLQKILEDSNIKLASVLSDITGQSARRMLFALLEGQSDLKAIARLAHWSVRATPEQLEQALAGQMGEHHRFLLRHALTHLEQLEEQIAAFDEEIARRIHSEPEPPPSSVSPGPVSGEGSEPPLPSSAPDQPADPLSFARAVELLDGITGISTRLAQVLVSEIGSQMQRFASAAHLASWAGVCPSNQVSAGKRLSGRTRKGNRYVREALVEAARAAANSKGTFLGAWYRRLKARLGSKKAIMALAHRILRLIYHLLHEQEAYQELGEPMISHRTQEARKRQAIRQLETLGYQVQLQADVSA